MGAGRCWQNVQYGPGKELGILVEGTFPLRPKAQAFRQTPSVYKLRFDCTSSCEPMVSNTKQGTHRMLFQGRVADHCAPEFVADMITHRTCRCILYSDFPHSLKSGVRKGNWASKRAFRCLHVPETAPGGAQPWDATGRDVRFFSQVGGDQGARAPHGTR